MTEQDVINSMSAQDRAALRAKRRAEFKTFDRRRLSRMDDRALAEWQSGFESDEAPWRLAEHEWQMRAGRFTRKIALAALIISLLSLVLSGLSYWQTNYGAASAHSAPSKPRP